jgi:hypothetical protein
MDMLEHEPGNSREAPNLPRHPFYFNYYTPKWVMQLLTL